MSENNEKNRDIDKEFDDMWTDTENEEWLNDNSLESLEEFSDECPMVGTFDEILDMSYAQRPFGVLLKEEDKACILEKIGYKVSSDYQTVSNSNGDSFSLEEAFDIESRKLAIKEFIKRYNEHNA